MKAKEIIARRVALEFKDGDVVNLGFGIPNASADYIPEGVNVILQAENGALRFGETPTKDTYNANLANSGGAPITLLPGAALFDLQTSFAIIRGGHVDATVLGALEVSQDGSIANWIIAGKFGIQDGKFLLKELAPGVTLEEVLEKTDGEVIVSEDLKTMPI